MWLKDEGGVNKLCVYCLDLMLVNTDRGRLTHKSV